MELEFSRTVHTGKEMNCYQNELLWMNQQVLDLEHEHHTHGTFVYRFSQKEIFKIILQFILFCLGVPSQ